MKRRLQTLLFMSLFAYNAFAQDSTVIKYLPPLPLPPPLTTMVDARPNNVGLIPAIDYNQIFEHPYDAVIIINGPCNQNEAPYFKDFAKIAERLAKRAKRPLYAVGNFDEGISTDSLQGALAQIHGNGQVSNPLILFNLHGVARAGHQLRLGIDKNPYGTLFDKVFGETLLQFNTITIFNRACYGQALKHSADLMPVGAFVLSMSNDDTYSLKAGNACLLKILRYEREPSRRSMLLLSLISTDFSRVATTECFFLHTGSHLVDITNLLIETPDPLRILGTLPVPMRQDINSYLKQLEKNIYTGTTAEKAILQKLADGS